MNECKRLPVESGEINLSFETFFAGLLSKDIVQAVFVPMRQPGGQMVMSSLVRKPEKLKNLDPLAPVTSTSAARLLSLLTYKQPGFRMAAFLRPCDYRAYVELIKLKQASRDDVLIVSVDCMGRLETKEFLSVVAEHGEKASLEFHLRQGKINQLPLLKACQVCEFPSYPGPDIEIILLGVNLQKEIILRAPTDQGKEALEVLELESAKEPEGRLPALEGLVRERTAKRDKIFEAYGEEISSFSGLRDIMKTCINCYNCRVACPVCYCRECVFVTDTFQHEPEQYFRWAEKRGHVTLPTDTVFYHLTRMIHMSTLCVGCGQCSTACPMDLPVMEVFRTVADKTQLRFNYQPGRNVEEPLPHAVFQDQEFLELAGE
jgi:formate dehydrogenase subunit beta